MSDHLQAIRVVSTLLWEEDAKFREYCHDKEYSFAHEDPKAREMMHRVIGIRAAMDALILDAIRMEKRND